MNISSAVTAGIALIIITTDLILGPFSSYCSGYGCYGFKEKYMVYHQLSHSHLFSNYNKITVWSVHLSKVTDHL